MIFINDVEFDNDDNPYASIKLHNYINMDNSTDTNKDYINDVRDEIIPLVPCQTESN